MTLHWITAALILANLLLGVSMVQLPISPRKINWYLWHKSIGISVFLLTSLRLAWRAWRPHPPPVWMPPWQQRAARVSHVSLYVLLLLIPLSGWLYSSATGVQVVYLGVVPLPGVLPKDRVLAAVLLGVHVTFNVLLVTVVAIHVAAALKHHFVDRDGVLARMLPLPRAGAARRRADAVSR
jgi:cytochrome b561